MGDDPAGGAPQVALVVLAELSAGEAVRLARDPSNDAIHEATPWAAVEGSGITPHRSRSQETRSHRRDQVRDGEGFPLHVADCASVWNCQLDAEIKPTSTGTEGDEAEGGVYSHVIPTSSTSIPAPASTATPRSA